MDENASTLSLMLMINKSNALPAAVLTIYDQIWKTNEALVIFNGLLLFVLSFASSEASIIYILVKCPSLSAGAAVSSSENGRRTRRGTNDPPPLA